MIIEVWADSNVTVTEFLHFKFLQDGVSQIGEVIDTYDGYASVDWTYPSSGAHTVSVHVWSAGSLAYMIEPVSLEVYRETVLRFWADRDNTAQTSPNYSRNPLNPRFNITLLASQKTVLKKLQSLSPEELAQIRHAFTKNVHQKFMKQFFHQPYGKREQYREKTQLASIEKLVKLIHVTALLLQTKAYLFCKKGAKFV